MATHSFTPVLGKRFRVTTLDECGAVVPGTAQTIVGDGFATLTLSSETEDGNEITQKNFGGALCVNERSADAFKYFTAEIEFCGVNPDLVTAMTNAEPYTDAGGDVAGFTVPEGEITKKFALEVWMGLSGQACAEGAEEASGYLLLPFVQAGVLGDIEINGEDAVTFSMTGAYTKGGNGWGVGPFDVVFGAGNEPSPLPEALDPLDHLLLMDTGLAVPAVTNELTTVTNPGARPAGGGGTTTTTTTKAAG